MNKYIRTIISDSGYHGDYFGSLTAINSGNYIYINSEANAGIHVYQQNTNSTWFPSHFITNSGNIKLVANNSGNTFFHAQPNTFTMFTSPINEFIGFGDITNISSEPINDLEIDENGKKIIYSIKTIGIKPRKVFLLDIDKPSSKFSYFNLEDKREKEFVDPTMTGLNCYKKIQVGIDHILVLRNDGKITGFGYDQGQANSGIPLSFMSGSNEIFVTDIAGFRKGNLAIYNSGSYTGLITGWGEGYDLTGHLNFPKNTGFIKIEASNAHFMAINKTGTVFSWGATGLENSIVPILPPPSIITGAIDISAGGFFTQSPWDVYPTLAPFCPVSLVLLNDGSCTGWGSNDSGQLNIPAYSTSEIKMSSISAGNYHSLFLFENKFVTGVGAESILDSFTFPFDAWRATKKIKAGDRFSILDIEGNQGLTGYGAAETLNNFTNYMVDPLYNSSLLYDTEPEVYVGEEHLSLRNPIDFDAGGDYWDNSYLAAAITEQGRLHIWGFGPTYKDIGLDGVYREEVLKVPTSLQNCTGVGNINSNFGDFIAINSGDLIFIGDSSYNNSGAIHVYSKKLNWERSGIITGSKNKINEFFGDNFDITNDGNTLTVGSSGSFGGSGSFYIFKNTGNFWEEKFNVTGFNQQYYSGLGSKIITNNSGNLIFVSSHSGSGCVHLYSGNDSIWTGIATISNPKYADLGRWNLNAFNKWTANKNLDTLVIPNPYIDNNFGAVYIITGDFTGNYFDFNTIREEEGNTDYQNCKNCCGIVPYLSVSGVRLNNLNKLSATLYMTIENKNCSSLVDSYAIYSNNKIIYSDLYAVSASGTYNNTINLYDISPINNWAELKLKINNISETYEIKTGFNVENY